MSGPQTTALEAFDEEHIGLSKGSLSFVLIITRNLKSKSFPINPDDFRTAEEGQVAGLGGGAIKRILREHGIDRVLSSEGGRTSRGNMGRLRAYAATLNALHHSGDLNLDAAENFWVERVKAFFQSTPFSFRLDASKSLRSCVRHLLDQAVERQRAAKGTMYAGAVMQHLVGAKLDLIKPNTIEHHGFSVADAPTSRSGDFILGDVAIHVTTAPSEGLIVKSNNNLGAGLRPLIITTEDGLGGAKALARQADLDERIDVIEIEQFLATNLYEWSKFDQQARPTTVRDLIDRYNKIVAECETDPSLRIEFEA